MKVSAYIVREVTIFLRDFPEGLTAPALAQLCSRSHQVVLAALCCLRDVGHAKEGSLGWYYLPNTPRRWI